MASTARSRASAARPDRKKGSQRIAGPQPQGLAIKPVAVHHELIAGLLPPPDTDDEDERQRAMKMSKSNPLSAVFVVLKLA